MSATKVSQPQEARSLTDDPIIEAQPVCGLLYGLLLAGLLWLLMAGLTLILF